MSSAKTTAASPAPRLADRYIRCDDFADRIDGIELAPEVWAVFAQLTQSRNATELAQHLQLDVEAVNASLRRLVRRKLIRKHVLGWRDYTATHAPFPMATAIAPISVAPVPTSTPILNHQSLIISPPAAPAPAAAPAVRSPILSFRIAGESKSLRPAPALSFRLESPTRPPSVSAPTSALNLNLSSSSTGPGSSSAGTGLRLRPILDAIGAKAGGGVAGQLLVYRVFLQLPTDLMQAAGLHSLSLVDDQFTLHHPELRAALAETARRHAGVDIEALASA